LLTEFVDEHKILSGPDAFAYVTAKIRHRPSVKFCLCQNLPIILITV